jgi:phosphatidylserine/phosphatidylglycerophosphate/cardiolipin synthase-like enzyme
MRINKIFFSAITLFCLHCTYSFSSASTPSESISRTAEVEALFLPKAQEEIFQRLTDFLGSAREKIVIAMYLLTSDTQVLDLLSKAKERKVDVQVILDESTLTRFQNVVTKLATYNIFPLVSLRPKSRKGKMHNKFIVVDNEKVWTDSANLTPTALRPDQQTYNDENIIIIKSPDIAKQYSDEFQRLEKRVVGFYMHHIDFTPIRSLPAWFKTLCIKLYETNNTFREKIFEALTDPQNMQLQEKIYTIIPALKMQPEAPQAHQEAAATSQPDIFNT